MKGRAQPALSIFISLFGRRRRPKRLIKRIKYFGYKVLKESASSKN